MRQDMWFQHGCREHYSMVAREVLDHDFNGHWIGRAAPVNWAVRFPDFSSPDLVYNQKCLCQNLSRHISQSIFNML